MENIIDWDNELLNRGYVKKNNHWEKDINGFQYRVTRNGKGILIDCPNSQLPNMPEEQIRYKQLDTIDDLDEFGRRASNGLPLVI